MGNHDWLIIEKGESPEDELQQLIRGCVEELTAQIEARRGHPVDPGKLKLTVEDHGDRLIVRLD